MNDAYTIKFINSLIITLNTEYKILFFVIIYLYYYNAQYFLDLTVMIRVGFTVLILCLMLVGNSCRPGKDYVVPPPDLPAPFSYKPAAVQLSEVYRSGGDPEKFVYDKGYLSEDQYAQYDLNRPYQTVYYKRQAGVLSSMALWQAQWQWVWGPGLYSDTLRYQSTLTFQSTEGDSLRKVIRSKPGEILEVRYGFDKDGFLMRVWDVEKGGNTFFERNNQHNISVSRRYDTSTNEPITTTYEYDNRPNPFYAIGRMADATVDTSPNNIVRSVSRRGNNSSVTTYNYTYRPDGYPEKAVIKNSSTAMVNTIVYKYKQ